MKTASQFIRIARFAAAATVAAGWQIGSLQAGPNDGFIHPGEPQVHASDAITQPTFDHLIPTTFPLIQVGEPTVKAGGNLIHPMDFSLVPRGAP